MSMELDLEVLTKISKEYEGAKSLAIREASEIVDVQQIKHIAEDRLTIGDEVQRINEEWNNQKEIFSQLIRKDQHPERTQTHEMQSTLLVTGEQQQNDDELQQTGFMALLMGNTSTPINGNVHHSSAEQPSVLKNEEQDYDLEYAMDLENLLFEDMI